MSAIIPYTETAPEEGLNLDGCIGGCRSGISSYGSVDEAQKPESAMAELTRLKWMRDAFGALLAEREFMIVQGKDKKFSIQLDKDILRDAVPWSGATNNHGHSQPYSLFTPTNAKMECPIFDLPSGAAEIGGTCPGATAGQWIVPAAKRAAQARVMLPPPGYSSKAKGSMPIDVSTSICSRCYASKGQYPSPIVQCGEIVRHWWAKRCMKDQQGREEFVEVVVEAALAIVPNKVNRDGIKPIRVHSSGDFFEPAYFESWMEVVQQVARRDPTILFWFPTRVWGYSGYDWSILDKVKNAVVRPSAYHMNDTAPEALREGNARGTTAIYHTENLGMKPSLEENAHPEAQDVFWQNRERLSKVKEWPGLSAFRPDDENYDPRYDWSCMTYAIGLSGEDLSKSCKNAIAPDGKIGCRACWTRRDLRICYTAH